MVYEKAVLDAKQLWLTDEHGNRLMPLEQLFSRFRLGGLGLGRYCTNDKAQLTVMLAATLTDAAKPGLGCQLSPEQAALIIAKLSEFVVSKSLAMPEAVINAKGYSLQEKIEAVCNCGR